MAALALSALFALLVIGQAWTTSPTNDETSHLPSGYTYWRWHDYRLNPEEPALVKKLAAFPLLFEAVWPPALQLRRSDLEPGAGGPSLLRAKVLWSAVLAHGPYQWAFGNQLLYGIRDETLARVHSVERWTVPATARLDPGDFQNDADRLMFRARMPVVLLGLLLGFLVYRWASELYGPPSGVLALALYAFDPSFIAHAGLVTTDVGVTLFMFAAIYGLWKSSLGLRVSRVAWTALAFGLALAAKYSAIILPAIFALLVLSRALSRSPWPIGRAGEATLSTLPTRLVAGVLLLASCLVAGYGVLWAVYDFRYSAARDPAEAAQAEAILSLGPKTGSGREPGHLAVEGVVRRAAALDEVGRRGRSPSTAESAVAPPGPIGTLVLFAQRHHLVPEAYLYGLANVQLGSYGRPGYLRGEYSTVGFRSYFLWTFLLKTPLVALALIGAALVRTAYRREAWGLHLAFLLVPVLVYWGVVLAATLNIGHRHLLPIYPFLYVLAGSLAAEWRRWPARARSWAGATALAAIVASAFIVLAPPWKPAFVYPHSLAYFNELAGGPRSGYRSLIDSNLDWGQDLGNLKRWLEARGIEGPINLSYFGLADPLYYGIPHVNLPEGFLLEPQERFVRRADGRLAITGVRPPGYVFISAMNLIGGGTDMSAEARASWQEFLRGARLVDTIGYSIFVYVLDEP
jgi:4-amino-4-deoxy-L-arabinose transferase-like glycosyltransferase